MNDYYTTEDYKALVEMSDFLERLIDALEPAAGVNPAPPTAGETPTVPAKNLYTEMLPFAGTPEYTGVVAQLQKWYYGSVVRAAWCATCVSYFLRVTYGDKYASVKAENVKILMDKCKAAGMQSIPISDMQQGDIVFFNWNAPAALTTTSSKHVSVYTGTPNQYLGGNQDDKLCVKTYSDKSKICGVYRP